MATGTEKTARDGVGGIAVALYAMVVALMLLQQPGATTYDTRAELTERPGDFLAGAFTLWHPESNFGEFQNQAYGYLFPQGTWFWLGDVLGSPGWVTQRLWSALILIVAWEGARRVSRVVGLGEGAALVAGAAFAMSPRLLGTVGVQTAESLPGAVMPWLVLPILLHLRGRLGPVVTALLSGAAVVCMGGVNAVETAGSLPLAIILVVWAVRTGRASRRFALQWAAAVGAACVWWALPLLVLARYAPPFFEYVESARDTTALIGWSEAVRGDSSWLGYLLAGDQPWWPAAFSLATDPWLVTLAAVVAAVGLVGLTTLADEVRRPLLFAAVVGLGCLTVAHGGVAGSPLAEPMRALLDGPLQIFRNVHKIDPVVRLPLAIGVGASVAASLAWLVGRWPRVASGARLLVLAPLVGVLALGQPFLAGEGRTPGWEEIASPWQRTQDYLAAVTRPTDRVLVVPGTSFALQDWGWTIDEPLAILGGVTTASRSQVPLIPGESLRYLSALDQLMATGRATEALAGQLTRAGISHVVLRRDLLLNETRSPHPGGTAVSLDHGGLTRLVGYGTTPGGESEVEVFGVPGSEPALRATDVDDVATVRGNAESILSLQSLGLVGQGATVLEGEPGWEGTPEVVTDTDQRRERAFGNNDEGLSVLMGAEEDYRVERAAHDYPGGPTGQQVVAAYDDGVAGVSASTSQGYADNYGAVTVQNGPQAAVDGDVDTRWISSAVGAPEEQWLRIDLTEPRPVRRVTVTPVAEDSFVVPIREVEVVAGSQHVRARVSADGVPVTVRFDGSEVDRVEVRIVAAATSARSARVGLREVRVDDLAPQRTFLVPGTAPAGAALSFATVPGRRACRVTLDVPDCDVARIRSAEERGGMDRTFATEADATVRITGHALTRSTPEAARLLTSFGSGLPVGVSSSYGQDPKVAGRFAYDGEASTAWVSDDTDLYPTLTFSWARERTISGIRVPVLGTDGAPAAVVVRGDDGIERQVPLRSDGVVDFRPVTTDVLTLRFVKAVGEPHVVVREVELTGADVTQPFIADAPGGAACGFGPVIHLDGRRITTRVTGTMADIANGSPLELVACDDDDHEAQVTVGPGEHRLVVEPSAELEMLDLVLAPVDDVHAASAGRRVAIEEWGSDRRTATVAAGPATVLSVAENFNDGWVAEVDGERLVPIRVDGWKQGWLLPAGGESEVQLRYAPQQTYDVVLPLGLTVSGGVLLGGVGALILTLARRRRRPGRPLEPTAPRVPDNAATVDTAWWAVAAVGTTLFLGPAALAGLVTGAWWRAPVVVASAGVLVAGSGLLDALTTASVLADVADLAAAVGVGGIAGVVLGRPRRPRHRRGEVAT